MDFFERQDCARRRTRWLLAFFLFAVVIIVGGVYGAVAALVHFGDLESGRWRGLWDPGLLLYASGGVLAVITTGSLVKILELRSGGAVVASSLGGRLIAPASQDPGERRLLNVVEEMALAAGVPVPAVFLLAEERGINAFAAGYSPGDAALGVTSGCLRWLTRDELQAIVAHEFSHVLNGDMRLNLRLVGLLNGILCLAHIGRFLMRSLRSSDDSKATGFLGLLGMTLLIIGGVGLLLGNLIKAAVSRQREFLADAAAVQFTRNSSALASALRKIGGLADGSRIVHPNAALASHMYFSNGMRSSRFNPLATHPSLTRRILAIDPSFDGTFPRPLEPAGGVPTTTTLSAGAPAACVTIAGSAFAPAVGEPTREHLVYAADFLDTLPEDIRTAAGTPFGAGALLFALVLDTDSGSPTPSTTSLAETLDPAMSAAFQQLQPAVGKLERNHRLPLMLLALPSLRQLSCEQFDRFESILDEAIASDQEIDLFEFTLQRSIRRHVAPTFHPQSRTAVQLYSLRLAGSECALVLSALAHLGGGPTEVGAASFRRGMKQLGHIPDPPALLPLDQCGLLEIDAALAHLNTAAPLLKRGFLEACASVVAEDGLIRAEEAELLRAIADALDCPVPAFIQGV